MVKSSSGESLPAGSVPSSHPYKIPQPPPAIAKYDSDFPLRKTGKIRLIHLARNNNSRSKTKKLKRKKEEEEEKPTTTTSFFR